MKIIQFTFSIIAVVCLSVLSVHAQVGPKGLHLRGFGQAQFREYAKIIDYLQAEGWTFMLPSEYLALQFLR